MNESNRMKAEGVIFDMDGLLFDTENVYQKAWHEIAEEMGITLTGEFVKTITGTNGRLLLSIVEKFYKVPDGAPILAECVKRASASLLKHVPVKEGVPEFLEYLKEKGVRTAVASSSDKEWIERYVEVAGLTEYFDEIVSGSEVAKGKPEPDVFLLASSRIAIPPQKCIVFEDSYNGVRAGHSSGAATIMIPDLLQPTEEIRNTADAVYESFTEFLRDADDWIA